MDWKEFKPTILFLIKFIGIYFIANIIYGLYVTSYQPQADPVTVAVTKQTGTILTLLGWPVATQVVKNKPTVAIIYHDQNIITVYEGCNAMNVVIIFIAFIFGFGPMQKKIWTFTALGIIIIYLSNILRILLLFWVTLSMPHYLYFTHKYLFTAFIYSFVFILWMIWVRSSSLKDMKP